MKRFEENKTYTNKNGREYEVVSIFYNEFNQKTVALKTFYMDRVINRVIKEKNGSEYCELVGYIGGPIVTAA